MADHGLAALFEQLRVADLAGKAACLADFARQHADALTLAAFPPPDEQHGALCVYELHRDETSGFTLYLNAWRPGAASAVHDHATWAIVVGLQGVEINRIYERVDAGQCRDHAELRLSCEAAVGPGDALVLPQGQFHSVHVPPGHAALQLHLYGLALDAQPERHAVDLASGRLVPLVPAVSSTGS